MFALFFFLPLASTCFKTNLFCHDFILFYLFIYLKKTKLRELVHSFCPETKNWFSCGRKFAINFLTEVRISRRKITNNAPILKVDPAWIRQLFIERIVYLVNLGNIDPAFVIYCDETGKMKNDFYYFFFKINIHQVDTNNVIIYFISNFFDLAQRLLPASNFT
jgi:hypothetical protein